jgi:hypothetical protein
MITDIRQNILSTLGSSEEYLIDRYPVNYFNSYIDIGARGTVSPNHVNHIGTNNPETQCIAYEPDIPYISELESKTQDLDNVHCNREGYGLGEIVIPGGSCASVTLSDIVEKYKIDTDSNWSIKFDCEGCEYFLFENEEDVDLLKKANHIAIEFHSTEHPVGNFFTRQNSLPNNFSNNENWMKENFSNTHNIFLTSKEPGLRTYVLITDQIIREKKNLFWDGII